MANEKNLNEDMVIVGQVYKEIEGSLEVIPFFVDFASSMVQFAPVSSGREDRMLSPAFLKRFKYLGAMSSRAENQTEKAPAKEDTPSATPRTAFAIEEEKRLAEEAKRK